MSRACPRVCGPTAISTAAISSSSRPSPEATSSVRARRRGASLAAGFADGIARPGGHLTGLSMIGPDLSGKRLAYLYEIVPELKSVAFVGWMRDQNTKTIVAGIEAAAAQLGVKLTVKLVD